MDRRSLLALAATFPMLLAEPADACSFAIRSPRFAGLQNQQVQKLFEAWWERDKEAFRAIFLQTLMADGSRMKRALADELMKLSPLPPNTFDVFDRFFLEERKDRKVVLIVNTDAGIIAGCSEADVQPEIAPDCSGTPSLHLFLVAMSGLNARSITHLSTVATPEPGKIDVWRG